MRAEIQQSKLKWSDDVTLERFSNRVILAIDPKFSDGDSDDQFSDFNIAKNKVYDFGRRCDLTEGEYLLALEMAMKGQLVLDEQKVKIYREINQINLSEVEQAYQIFKQQDAKYSHGKKELQKFLTPAPKEVTPEELKKLRLENIKKDYHRFNADGKVLATHLFYDLIKKTRGEKIRLEFVETFLKNFVPEVAEGKLTATGSTQMPRVIKKDVYVEFQDEIIKQYVMHLKINEQTESEWVKHWENILNQV
ncbi:MAG: hypothetical protein RSE50_00940 [Myroides sp.]